MLVARGTTLFRTLLGQQCPQLCLWPLQSSTLCVWQFGLAFSLGKPPMSAAHLLKTQADITGLGDRMAILFGVFSGFF